MATSDIKVKIIDIQIKYQDAVDAMGKYRQSIVEAQNTLKQLKKDLKDGKITQEEYNRQSEASRTFIKQQNDAINTLSRQVQNQIKVTKENEGSLKQLRAELSNATAAFDAMSRSERDSAKGRELRNHIVEITNELKSAEQETLRFYRNVGNYPSSVDTNFAGLSEKIKGIKNDLLGLATGGGLIAMAKSIKDVGTEFDDAMARVNAVTMATKEEFEMMRDEALRVGAATAYSSKEAADALENLTRNGLSAKEATDALMPTLQFAQANTIGLAEAADIMTNVSNGFNLGVEGMARVSDALSWSASHSATDVSGLAEALKNAAPFGAALGQPIEEVNAALGVLADVGIKASDAGTALRMIMLGLATSTSKQQAVFEKFGININQQTMKADGLTRTLEKLRDSGIMKSANSANELADVFGRRVSPQAMALLNNIDSLKEKLEGLQDAQGTTGDMFERSMSKATLAGMEFENQIETMGLKIWDSSQSTFTNIMNTINSFLNWINQNFSDVAKVVMSIIAGVSFAKLISGAKSAFTQIKESAVTNAQAATNNLQVCQNNELAIRKQCASLTYQLENASASERERIETQLVAKKRELANAEKTTQKAKTAEIALWERAAAMETGNRWTQAFTLAKMGVTSFVTTAKTAFKGFILTAVLSLAFELIMKLYEKIKEGGGVFSTFSKWASAAWTAILKGVVSVINYFIDLYNESMIVRAGVQLVAAQFKNLWEGVKLIFSLIIDGVKSVGRALSGMGTILKGIITFSPETIKQGWNEITSNFTKTIKEGAEDFKNFGKAVADNVINAYNNTIKGAKVAHIKVPEAETVPSATPKKKTVYKASDGKVYQTREEALKHNQEIKDEDTKDNDTVELDSGSNSKSKSTAKEEKARAKAAQEEAKLVAEAEKAMLELLGESMEKRKALLESQYNGEINKLKAKLDTDKTLTENSKDAIRQLITAKEAKLQEELDKLDEDNLKKRIQEQQKLLDSRIAIVRKGSEEEMKIKMQEADEKLKLDMLELRSQEEAAQKGAATALMFRQKVLDELKASGTATEEQLTKAKEAVAFAQSEITRINEEYAELRINKQKEHNIKEDELRRAHDQAVFDEKIQTLQNEATQMDIWETERMNSKSPDNVFNGNTVQENIDAQQLDVVTEFELAKLAIQQDMAEQRLQFIKDQGQLETETEEQYNARVLAGKQAVVNAKAQYNQAQLKNEQAYAKAMKGVGDSLISVIDAIGEKDENFAKLSKVIALFKIAVDTGKAISAGIANAMELPFPANLAAVATSVATVLANIATAISTVQSAKFAEGGKVYGPGTGTSDSIPANLSNGEFVMTAKATRMFEPLLVAMNSIGTGVPISTPTVYERVEDAESMSDTFAAVVREINPVVSVVEITEAQDRIKMIENLDTF